MEKQKTKTLINNTIMMYVLSITKLVIPLISLPYLTRVLSVDCYGSVSFVKSIVSYLQILIDFGFLYSATKDIITIIKNKGNVNREIGNTFYAQLLLSALSLVIVIVCSFTISTLDGFELFTILSSITAVLSIFLFEYVFKAYEQMGKIAVRFIVFKTIALILTLIFVRSDQDIILIPIFDIFASVISIVLVVLQLKKLGVKIDFSFRRIREAFVSLRKSLVCFLSNFSSTVFTLLNTVLIGLILTKTEVAHWTLSMQLITAVHALYNPIINSVYPIMIKEKNLKIIHRIMLIYIPLIVVGSVLVYFFSDWLVELLFTEKYLTSAKIFVCMIPVLIASFPSMLYGWPALSAIDNERGYSFTILLGVCVHIIGIIVLMISHQFTLINLAIIKCITEIVLCISRIILVYKNRRKFNLTTSTVKDITICRN